MMMIRMMLIMILYLLKGPIRNRRRLRFGFPRLHQMEGCFTSTPLPASVL